MPPPTSYSSAKVIRPPSMSDAFAVVPHVERDHVVELGRRREVPGADDSRGRTALDDAGGILRDRAGVIVCCVTQSRR